MTIAYRDSRCVCSRLSFSCAASIGGPASEGSTRKWFDFVVVDAYNACDFLLVAHPIATFAIVIFPGWHRRSSFIPSRHRPSFLRLSVVLSS